MQNRSYKQLLDRVREMEVSSYESTVSRFLHSLESGKATPAIAKKLIVRSSFSVLALILLLATVLPEQQQQQLAHDVYRQTTPTPLSATVSTENRQVYRSEATIADPSKHSPASVYNTPGIASDSNVTDGNADAAHAQLDDGSLAIASTIADIQIATIQPVAPADISLLSNRELSRFAHVELSQSSTGIQLLIAYAGMSGLASNSLHARGTALINISDECAIGVVVGLLTKEHRHTQFNGFKDTVIQIGPAQYNSRVGQFDYTSYRMTRLGYGAAISYRPQSLTIAESIIPSFMLIGGFDGTQLFVEPSVLISYPFSSSFSAVAGLSATTPLSSIAVRLFPVAGISTSF